MTAEHRHMFVGELTDTPLPEMLATIYRHRVPGLLEVTTEDSIRRVVISGGDILFASSTNRAESLGDMLLAAGRLTMEQYRASTMVMTLETGRRHGQILVDMGVLSEADLRTAVLEQVQRIVWRLFDVHEGRVTFTLGNFSAQEEHRLRIPTPRAILHGCKTVAEAKRLVSRLGSKSSVFLRPNLPEHLAGLELEPGEQTLLELVDGKRTLLELCEQGPFSAGLNARVLYAFHAMGMIQRKDSSTGIKVQVPSTNPPM